MIQQITRKFEFDAGHRIPNHQSLCKNLHGHRYVLEATLQGAIINDAAAADFGMVLDFGAIKQIIKSGLIDLWDHAFLVYEHDTVVKDFLMQLPQHKTVVLPCVPTAENLVKIAFASIAALISKHFGCAIALTHVRLYETPNCWADYADASSNFI